MWLGIVDAFRTFLAEVLVDQRGAGRDISRFAGRVGDRPITRLISLAAVPGFRYSGTWSFSLNWVGWLCLALPAALVILITLTHSRNRAAAETRTGLELESDLQQEVARCGSSDYAPSWEAPMLPASIIASIWTGRFIATTQQSVETRRFASTLGVMSWNFNRAALYITSVAFMSLRDAGLIRISMDSLQRVLIEPTDLARSTSDLPPVEGGLLSASLAFSDKRFGKTTEPAANAVVREWIHRTQNQPWRWVVEIAVQQGRELGLYEPVVDDRGGFQKMFGGSPQPVYAIPHLAACENQVVACVSRWQEFGVNEPELQQRLIAEVAFGTYARQASGG